MAGRSLLKTLLNDPPPRFVFEVSEAGLAIAHIADGTPKILFQPLEEGTVVPSPVKDNVLNMDQVTAQVQAVAPRREKKRLRAAVIVPDFSVRVTVLDFDAFPADAQEQMSLVRFRIKKSLPFDVDSASLSYYAQPDGNGRRVDVVVAVSPMEILARYETPFRAAGFHTGLLTTSALCAIQMVPRDAVALLAKLSGQVLTLAVLDHGRLKLLRSIELSGGGISEVASHFYPTFAYMEDQLGAKPQQIMTCGFARLNDDLAHEVQESCVPVRSRFGMPDQFNAGLLGYLESSEELQ